MPLSAATSLASNLLPRFPSTTFFDSRYAQGHHRALLARDYLLRRAAAVLVVKIYHFRLLLYASSSSETAAGLQDFSRATTTHIQTQSVLRGRASKLRLHRVPWANAGLLLLTRGKARSLRQRGWAWVCTTSTKSIRPPRLQVRDRL